MPRIAVISDIHGNCTALDAVLTDAWQQVVSQFVCLGDSVPGGVQPALTVQRLRELDCPIVMGNADASLVARQERKPEQISDEGMRKLRAISEWTYRQLAKDDLELIASFPLTVEIPLGDGRSLLAFHGSPSSFNDIILPQTPEDQFQQFLIGYVPRIMAGGHVHMQFVRRLGNTFFFNPGSVGAAYDRQQEEDNFHIDPWAEYAILSVDEGLTALEFRRVSYDVASLIAIYRASDYPFATDAIRERAC